jgi:hypothetical protein
MYFSYFNKVQLAMACYALVSLAWNASGCMELRERLRRDGGAGCVALRERLRRDGGMRHIPQYVTKNKQQLSRPGCRNWVFGLTVSLPDCRFFFLD